MMQSPTTPKVMHRDYRAGVAQLILPEPDGSISVNLWQRGGVTPAAGNYQPILDFFARFLPDTLSREHVLKYLAHLVQHPGEKIEHGVIITGGYGTGKNTLYRIVTSIFGIKNARELDGVELGEDYTARLVDTQILMIEEAHHGERLEVFEKTKELLTNEFYYAHDKYVRRFRGRTPRGIFLTSNDAAPMVLPRGDRRWFVCATPETPETEEEKKANRAFFKQLYDLLDRDDSAVAAFAEYLRTLSLEGFNAKGAPPMTKAKEVATEESRTPIAQMLAELIHAGGIPFHRDVMSVPEVIHALKTSTWADNLERLNPKKAARAMQDLGARKVNMEGDDHMEMVIGPGKRMYPWAIRNVARWRAATREELKAEAARPVTEQLVADLSETRLKKMMQEAARKASA
ncbi:MAG: primase-helicase family protein [Methylorubrum rhodinum]|uniref:primase-helicase family protein n=1 Tax=Methylorubrum rhodinum TaxID=29428 RepID=UPI003BB1549E